MSVRQLLLPAGIAAAAAAIAAGSAGATTSDCFSGWNPPNTLMLAAGSPQQGQIGKSFLTNLQVQLANTDGCPLTGSWAGVSVVFTAPSSGPSGTFASTGANVADVGTDASGTATAPAFTANRVSGDYEVIASSSYGSVTLYLTNTATGIPAAISPRGGSGQSVTVGGSYQPLQALVLDGNGQPVAGASVTFQLMSGSTGAGASFATGGQQAIALTDASGVATSAALIANDTAGRFSATASTDQVSAAVTYPLRNLLPRLATVTRVLAATVARHYRRPLQARVRDAHGRPVRGIAVIFKLPPALAGAGATFVDGTSQETATTNRQGYASSPPLIANSTSGQFTATAQLAGDTHAVAYSLHNRPGRPATVTAGAASGESTLVGGSFRIPLAVTVTDEEGNPVAGATVTFTAPTRGPSARFRRVSRVVRVKTDVKGVAVAPRLTANQQSGGYVVTAQAGATRATFALVNTPR